MFDTVDPGGIQLEFFFVDEVKRSNSDFTSPGEVLSTE